MEATQWNTEGRCGGHCLKLEFGQGATWWCKGSVTFTTHITHHNLLIQVQECKPPWSVSIPQIHTRDVVCLWNEGSVSHWMEEWGQRCSHIYICDTMLNICLTVFNCVWCPWMTMFDLWVVCLRCWPQHAMYLTYMFNYVQLLLWCTKHIFNCVHRIYGKHS